MIQFGIHVYMLLSAHCYCTYTATYRKVMQAGLRSMLLNLEMERRSIQTDTISCPSTASRASHHQTDANRLRMSSVTSLSSRALPGFDQLTSCTAALTSLRNTSGVSATSNISTLSIVHFRPGDKSIQQSSLVPLVRTVAATSSRITR